MGAYPLKILTTLKHRLDVTGFSLIEVIISILLLSIVILGFFSLLISSAKTTKVSESITNSTYTVQKEMETLYSLSMGTEFNKKEDAINDLGYSKAPNDLSCMNDEENENWKGNTFERIPSSSQKVPLNNTKFILVLSDYNTGSSELSTTHEINNEKLYLSKVIIKLCDRDVLKAKVENTIEWRPATN